jgi:hypothetical protein
VSGRDIGASVRQRLLNKSRAQGRPFQELLQYFAMERFLYRLAKSPYSDRFVLKVALLLTAWRAPQSRPTVDIDLAGQVNNQLDHINEVVGTVCEVDVGWHRIQSDFNRGEPDQRRRGLRRCPESSSTQRSREREFQCNSISASAMSLLRDPRT